MLNNLTIKSSGLNDFANKNQHNQNNQEFSRLEINNFIQSIEVILKNYNLSKTAKIAAVIGDPVKQSLSPFLHNYWLKQNHIEGLYFPLQISAANLPLFFASLPILKNQFNFLGCNITIPHKEAALKLCTNLSPAAQVIGAVNTIYFNQQNDIIGDNSDYFGFIQNIKNNHPNFNFLGKKVLILGAGGAAMAVIFGLIKQGVSDIIIANRNFAKAEVLVNKFSKLIKNSTDKILPRSLSAVTWQNYDKNLLDIDILVNCTSLGMVGEEPLLINLSKIRKSTMVCDIVYKPLMTNLLINAKAQQNPITTGIGMLIYQGLLGFEKWFNVVAKADNLLISKMIEISNLKIS